MNERVVRILARGDVEGKSTLELGYYTGELEDILRKVVPEANRTPARFGVDYEVDILCYPSIKEAIKSQLEFTRYPVYPNFVPPQSPLGKRVAINVHKKDINRIIAELNRKNIKYEITKDIWAEVFGDKVLIVEI